MNHSDSPAYGLWSLAIINSLVFIIFAFSFSKPKSPRDWRTFGAFSAFLIALFTEMYGFPLTIYLFSGWLSQHFPGVNFLSHDAGHLLEALFGWSRNPHFGPFHIASNILIAAGFWLLAAAWKVLFEAQRQHKLATTGHNWPLRTRAAPSICRFYPDYDGIFISMANTYNRHYVSNPRSHVRAPGNTRGTRSAYRIRRAIQCICDQNATVFPTYTLGSH